MATIDTPTSAEPPSDGPVVASQGGPLVPQMAPHADLEATVADAVAAGMAWSNEAGKILNSPQGFGLDGYCRSPLTGAAATGRRHDVPPPGPVGCTRRRTRSRPAR